MSLPPGPPPTPATNETVGLPPTARSTLANSLDWSRLPAGAAALGVSLVSAAVVMSAAYSRERGDLDTSNFAMGVLSTLGLLASSAGAFVALPRSAHRTLVVSWSGAAGVLSSGLMVSVLIDDDPVSTYVGAGLVVLLSAVGYATTRSAPFLLSGILGLALLYGQIFADVIEPSGDGRNTFMIVAAAIVAFVVAVTAACWPLPETRVLTGVVVGAGGLVAFAVLFQALMVARFFTAFGGSAEVGVPGFAPDPDFAPEGDLGFDPEQGPAAVPEGFPSLDEMQRAFRDNPYRDDVYVILLCCGLLAVLWIVCHVLTGHVGFRVLVVATAVTAVPMATLALIVSHPTWWEVASCALGAIVLVGSARGTRRRRPVAPEVTAP